MTVLCRQHCGVIVNPALVPDQPTQIAYVLAAVILDICAFLPVCRSPVWVSVLLFSNDSSGIEAS